MATATSRIGVGTSVTHFGTRHPIALAAWGATMQKLSGGRFLFGFGRSGNQRWKNWGIPVPTLESMGDYASILRRLWAGEKFSYDGPAGSYPKLGFDLAFDVDRGQFPPLDDPPPLLLAAVGPRTLELAGRSFDGVLLHPFLTVDAVARSVSIAKGAAERAGRDPEALRVYHQIVVAPDLPEKAVDEVVYLRAAAYLSMPAYAKETFLASNGWDDKHFEPFWTAADQAIAENSRLGGPLVNRAVLASTIDLLPRSLLASGAAIGSAETCAKRLLEYFGAGADEIVVHGSTAQQVGPLMAAMAVAR